MNLFTKDEKKYIRRSPVSAEATSKNQLLLQMQSTCAEYSFWKNKLSEVNKNIVNLKKDKTNTYLARQKLGVPFTEDLQSINQKLLWWRSYYPEALKCYRNAKRCYYMAQKLYSQFDEKQQTKSQPLAPRTLKGEFGYQVVVSRGDWNRFYYIRSDSDYLDENNFKDEFEYDMDLAVEKHGEKLKAYNWNAYWTLFTLRNFYKGQDVKVDIRRAPLMADKCVLIDFAAFKARRADKVADSIRLTFEEFVSLKKKELGDGACVGFGSWFVFNRKKVLERQYRGREARDIMLSMKKTLRYWNKFYDKYAIEFTRNLEVSIKRLSKS